MLLLKKQFCHWLSQRDLFGTELLRHWLEFWMAILYFYIMACIHLQKKILKFRFDEIFIFFKIKKNWTHFWWCLGLTFVPSSLSLNGNNCCTASGLATKLVIPLELLELPPLKLAELAKLTVDFFEVFVSLLRLLNLTGICCFISWLDNMGFIGFWLELVALIKCKLARDSFFRLPPVTGKKKIQIFIINLLKKHSRSWTCQVILYNTVFWNPKKCNLGRLKSPLNFLTRQSRTHILICNIFPFLENCVISLYYKNFLHIS